MSITTRNLLPIVAFIGSFLPLAVPALAQQGDNAVFNSSNAVQGSSAWIDASAFCLSGGNGGTSHCNNGQSGPYYDICAMIVAALQPILTAGGGVIDARGVVPSAANPQQLCDSNNSNPFAGISANNSAPITVLLPASTIGLTAPWVLPSNVHLVGMGTQTMLFPSSSSIFTNSAMIVMGTQSCSPCSGISVEHLQMSGLVSNAPAAFEGIDNQDAAASSYVNDVGISNVTEAGLSVESGAANSGPYTNISFSANTGTNKCSASNAPQCVILNAQTTGLHGITCVGDVATSIAGTGPEPAISVTAGNNSIEDVHAESYEDGVRIGDISGGSVSNVVVSNVFTSASNSCPSSAQYVTNTVRICVVIPPTLASSDNAAIRPLL